MRGVSRLALLVVIGLAFAAASCFPDDSPRISIEFGMVPELEGSDVLIDGKVVGKLEMTGRSTRISFPVKPGEHEVTLRSPRFDCQPAKVHAEMKGQKVRLMANVGETMSATPGGKPVVTFQH